MLLTVALLSSAGASAQPGHDEPATAGDLVQQLIALPGAAERDALLARHAALVDAALVRALVAEARARIEATDFRGARGAYELAIALAERFGDEVNLASALIGLGSVHGRQGDYGAADERLRAGLAVAEAIRDVERIDAALHNLGIVHRLQGNYEAALAYYQRVVALAEETDRMHVLGPTYNNIGVVHLFRGSYRAALDALHRSIALKEEAGDRASLRSTLTNIGNVHLQQGHPELALDYYRRSLDLAHEFGQQARTAGTLSDMGYAYAALGRHQLALDHYERALALHEAAGQQAEIATTLHNFGRAHAARGDLDAAFASHSRSRAIREAINDRPGLADTLIALGDLALRRGEASAALDLADRAARLAAETGSRESFWRARLLAGRIDEARGAFEPARRAYLDAIDTIEALRADVAGGARDRQRYFERKLQPYHRLVGLLVARGQRVAALDAAERARARVLSEVLRDGPAERRLLTVDERTRERELERRLADLRASLWAEASRTGPDEAILNRLRGELVTARRAHAEFRAVLHAAHPALRLHRGETAAGSVDAAADLLPDERAAILEFLVTEEATYLFVVRRSPGGGERHVQVDAFRVDLPGDRLTSLVSQFRGRLAQRDLDFRRIARETHDALLGAAREALEDCTSLIVVPDGALWALPFQALQDRGGRYLIERAAIAYAPSIGVLAELRARHGAIRNARSPSLLALADPRPSSGAPGAARREPFALEPLPDAARQAEALSRLYGPDRSQVLLGPAATEPALRAASHDVTVLHFATHGVMDDASPMYSFLLLSGDAKSEAAADGRLEAWEVADLSLPVEAVVLAACETALGRVGPGEGMIGLSWAFFLAGSPRTVASLWKVDAASTTELMLVFHDRFRAGLTGGDPAAAASLQAGALALLRSRQYRHPFYWASFILIGDGM